MSYQGMGSAVAGCVANCEFHVSGGVSDDEKPQALSGRPSPYPV